MRLFISQMVGRPVLGSDGERLGSLRDLVVALDDSPYPPVRGLIVHAGRHDRFVPVGEVAALAPDGVRLRLSMLTEEEFQRRDGEALVEDDLLDHQLIDVEGARVVRASDAEIREVEGVWSLVAIDAGAKGMLRRLGLRRVVGNPEGELIDWAVVEPLATEVPEVQLTVSHAKLAKLHPSDIARIVDTLAFPQSAEVLQALDDTTAAETLEEVQEDRQADLLDTLPPERAADILEEMAPDAAADVLDGMPREQADALMREMDQKESSEVQGLLRFPEDTAGGLMTTEFVGARAQDTVGQLLDNLRRHPDDADPAYGVYVVDDGARLQGAVAVGHLLLAQPEQEIGALMDTDVRSVQPEASAEEVARLMAEYNLLALPVTDDTGRLLGLVTVDDALDEVLPQPLKQHVARLFG